MAESDKLNLSVEAMKDLTREIRELKVLFLDDIKADLKENLDVQRACLMELNEIKNTLKAISDDGLKVNTV